MFKIRLDNYGFILTIAELFFLSLKTAEPNLVATRMTLVNGYQQSYLKKTCLEKNLRHLILLKIHQIKQTNPVNILIA